MKLKISFIILLFLFIFILSCKKENFQNSLINMPKGFVAIKGNFFSQGENPAELTLLKLTLVVLLKNMVNLVK